MYFMCCPLCVSLYIKYVASVCVCEHCFCLCMCVCMCVFYCEYSLWGVCTEQAGRQTPAQRVLFYSWWVIPALHLLNLLPWSVCPEFSPITPPLPPSHFLCLWLCLSGYVQLRFPLQYHKNVIVSNKYSCVISVCRQEVDIKSSRLHGMWLAVH